MTDSPTPASTRSPKGKSSEKTTSRKSRAPKSAREESILANALELFRNQGYQKTSMTQIARAAGMDQSSLYYHFPSKEHLLNRLFDFKAITREFESIAQLVMSNTQRLYLTIVYDVVAKCDLPFDFFEFESVASDNPEAFADLFELYKTVYQGLLDSVTNGISSKEFSECNPAERTVTILSINEGLQHHYHAKLRGQLILESAGYQTRNLSPEEIGHLSATLVLSRICLDQPDFEALRKSSISFLSNVEHLWSPAN